MMLGKTLPFYPVFSLLSFCCDCTWKGMIVTSFVFINIIIIVV